MGKEAEDRQGAGIVTYDFSEEAEAERLRATRFQSETPPKGVPFPSTLSPDSPVPDMPQRSENPPFGSLLWRWLKKRWTGGAD